jgi:ribosome biogenesis GTPase
MGLVADLETLGWDDSWRAAFEPHQAAGLAPGRVAAGHRGAYDVVTAEGEARARVSGRLRHEASPADLPVVGDWVALDLRGSRATIHAVLPRRTKFSRLNVAREQVVAANVDVVFVVSSLSEPLDPRVLERYLTLAWESGARPVILLTKADLEPDPEAVAGELSGMGGDVPVHAISARSGFGLDHVRSYLGPGVTGALLGPSGVGKSTLVNRLVGEDDLLPTAAVRDDGSGRHTTTRRQLVSLPGGGLVVDNPGMREVHLWLAEEGLEAAFPDIVELAAHCRFSDCSHEAEPDCAVQAALADGSLAPERWRSYRDLRLELAELEERLARRRRAPGRRPGAGAPRGG